ncbi:hypothetical protein [Bradyrhizobium sp. STM 3562]|uniref:hypothetical protein n=1 Tax=Bradyrhizobium sp. STM 3562 TaxID=578924 RepID=UPI00388D0ED7
MSWATAKWQFSNNEIRIRPTRFISGGQALAIDFVGAISKSLMAQKPLEQRSVVNACRQLEQNFSRSARSQIIADHAPIESPLLLIGPEQLLMLMWIYADQYLAAERIS